MKLIWHIIKKDIARERWALALWTLLFLTHVGLGVFLLHGDGRDAAFIFARQKGSSVLAVVQFAVTYILVARLVQADAPIGTRAFWLTRPISGGRLLFAKVLGALLLFALLPVLLLLPWWLYCSFGIQEILWTALEVFGWQLLVVAPAFLVAALTDDLGRVLLWTLLLLTVFLGWIVLMQSSMAVRMIGAVGDAVRGAIYTRVLLSALVLIVGSMVVVTYQYLTRRFVHSMILAAVTLGLIALIGQTWRWDWSPYLVRVYESSHRAPVLPSDLAKNVALTLGTVSVYGSRQLEGKGESMIRLTWKTAGVPAGVVAGLTNSVGTWSWSEGATITREQMYSSGNPWDLPLRKMLSLSNFTEDAETARWERLKLNERKRMTGFIIGTPFEPGDFTVQSNFSLPNSVIAHIGKEPPVYSATVQGLLWEPEVVVELPLKEGARQSGISMTFLLQRVRQMGDAADVQVVTTESALMKNGLWLALVSRDRTVFAIRGSFLLVNRFLGSLQHVTGNVTTASAQVGGVRIAWSPFSVRPDTIVRESRWVVRDPDWFTHTTLVVYVGKPMAQFTRDLKVEKFELNRQ